jgi:glycosyltransferase involved in cell wall biosynthesis
MQLKPLLGYACAAACAFAIALPFAGPVQAQYPERPITIVVPWGAGGGTDATARIIATLLEEDLGQPHRRVVVGRQLTSRGLREIVASNWSRIRGIRRGVRYARAQVVVSFIDWTNVLTLLATRGLGVPVVVSERVDPGVHEVDRLTRWLRRGVYPWANALVVQTEQVKTWGSRIAGEGRVRVIPNPVLRPPAEESIERANRHIVAVGRLTPQKGFDVLLQAFAQIADRCGLVGASCVRVEIADAAAGTPLRDTARHAVGALRRGVVAYDMLT